MLKLKLMSLCSSSIFSLIFPEQSDSRVLNSKYNIHLRSWSCRAETLLKGLRVLLKGTHPASRPFIPLCRPPAKEPRSPWTSSPISHPSILPCILATAPKSNWTAHERGLNGKDHKYTLAHMIHTHTLPLFLPVCSYLLSLFLFHPRSVFLLLQSLSQSQQSGSVVQSWTKKPQFAPIRKCVSVRLNTGRLLCVCVCVCVCVCELCVLHKQM